MLASQRMKRLNNKVYTELPSASLQTDSFLVSAQITKKCLLITCRRLRTGYTTLHQRLHWASRSNLTVYEKPWEDRLWRFICHREYSLISIDTWRRPLQKSQRDYSNKVTSYAALLRRILSRIHKKLSTWASVTRSRLILTRKIKMTIWRTAHIIGVLKNQKRQTSLLHEVLAYHLEALSNQFSNKSSRPMTPFRLNSRLW